MQEDDQASRQELLPITKVPRRGLPHFGLVCGDPARQHRISQLLSGPVELARTREYTTSVGSWKGLGVVVSSHGVGASGALLMFHELMMAGVTTIIRVGTCGSLRQEIEDGDLIIAEAAVRADGVTDQLVTLGYPAFSSPKVVLALMRAAKHSSARYHKGIVLTRGIFDPMASRSREQTSLYSLPGVIGVEMELSALLVQGALMGVRTGGILTVDGNVAREVDYGDYNPDRPIVDDGVNSSILIALDALTLLNDERTAST